MPGELEKGFAWVKDHLSPRKEGWQGVLERGSDDRAFVKGQSKG